MAAGDEGRDSQPLRFQVFEELRRLIVAGMLLPGQQLREEELASELRVSRGPVRDALQLLEARGWAEIRPRAGVFVREPSPREIEELFELRMVLEEHCARAAASGATAEDIDRLRRALEDADRELAREPSHRRTHPRESVHRCIRDIAGNHRISELAADLDHRVAWFFVPIVRSRREQARAEHHDLVDAIAHGETDRAGAIARDHCHAMYASFVAWQAAHEPARSDPPDPPDHLAGDDADITAEVAVRAGTPSDDPTEERR